MHLALVLPILCCVSAWAISLGPAEQLRGRRGLSTVPSDGIAKLRLINADTGEPVQGYDPLTPNALIDLNLVSTTSFSIEAITEGSVGSVQWNVNGKILVDNSARWSLCGNKGSDFFKCNQLQLGSNATIKATAFTGKQATGMSYPSVSVNVAFYESKLLSLTLVDAFTGLDIGPLHPGTIIDLSVTPNINVRADVYPVLSPGSVHFALIGDDTFDKTESNAPFVFLGDKDADNSEWAPNLGQFTLSAIAFTGKNHQGSPLAFVETSFTVVETLPDTNLRALSLPADKPASFLV